MQHYQCLVQYLGGHNGQRPAPSYKLSAANKHFNCSAVAYVRLGFGLGSEIESIRPRRIQID